MKDRDLKTAQQTHLLNGPSSESYISKDFNQSTTPTTTPPDLPYRFQLTNHLAKNVAVKISQELEEYGYLDIKKELSNGLILQLSNLLEKTIAHNGRYYIDTCDESCHFENIFIAHAVEKLVEILETNPGWSPNSKDLNLLLKEIDEALKEEDDFRLNKGDFVSWHEPESPLTLSLYADSAQNLEVPIIGNCNSDGSVTNSGNESSDSINSLMNIP